jgi:hypothetical protein
VYLRNNFRQLWTHTSSVCKMHCMIWT